MGIDSTRLEAERCRQDALYCVIGKFCQTIAIFKDATRITLPPIIHFSFPLKTYVLVEQEAM